MKEKARETSAGSGMMGRWRGGSRSWQGAGVRRGREQESRFSWTVQDALSRYSFRSPRRFLSQPLMLQGHGQENGAHNYNTLA